VPVDLNKAKKDAQDFEIAVVFNILVSGLIAALADLEAVIVVLQEANDLGDLTTLNTDG
jgi:hypothetical protein